MNKVQTVILSLGAVETASWSQLIFHNTVGFDDIESALVSISRALFKGFEDERQEVSRCCRRTIADAALATFYCRTCGARLHEVKKRFIDPIDIDGFSALMHELFGAISNQFPEVWEELSCEGWEVWHSNRFSLENIVHVSNAAYVMFSPTRQNDSDYDYNISYPKGVMRRR